MLGLLGIKEYEVKTVSGAWGDDHEKVKILMEACKKYKKTHENGTLLAV